VQLPGDVDDSEITAEAIAHADFIQLGLMLEA
jgi:hypothetical protein